MKTMISSLVPLFMIFISCHEDIGKNSIEKWKQEIVETEKEFADMAAKEGIQAAFVHYAAEDVTIHRNDSLISGREALLAFYSKRGSEPGVSLTWEPDFVDVSVSGDLGYTYGKYTYTFTDSTGMSRSSRGIFHTVWKRQEDGAWRFVWD